MEAQETHFIRCLEALKDSIFFKNVPSLALRELLQLMAREQWPAGESKDFRMLALQFHFILSGKIKVFQLNPETEREHTIFILVAGDVFDVMCLLDAEPHDVLWETLEPLDIITIPMASMRSWMDHNPQIHKSVIHYMGKRMREMEQLRTDTALYNTLVRLAHLILRNVNVESRQLEHIDNLPNHEIASLLGTTRAVVNRHIQELKKCGAISVRRGQIAIENIDSLLQVVDDKAFHRE